MQSSKRKNATVSVRLPEDIQLAVLKKSHDEGLPFSEFICRAIQREMSVSDCGSVEGCAEGKHGSNG